MPSGHVGWTLGSILAPGITGTRPPPPPSRTTSLGVAPKPGALENSELSPGRASERSWATVRWGAAGGERKAPQTRALGTPSQEGTPSAPLLAGTLSTPAAPAEPPRRPLSPNPRSPDPGARSREHRPRVSDTRSDTPGTERFPRRPPTPSPLSQEPPSRRLTRNRDQSDADRARKLPERRPGQRPPATFRPRE